MPRSAGAGTIKNLDLSRKVLAWGQDNYALSHLSAPDTDFLYGDVFEWLRRLGKRNETFDLVILDPPSFARSKAGVWRSERQYARLPAQAAAVTAPGGQILALINHAGVSAAAFERSWGGRGAGGPGHDRHGPLRRGRGLSGGRAPEGAGAATGLTVRLNLSWLSVTGRPHLSLITSGCVVGTVTFTVWAA